MTARSRSPFRAPGRLLLALAAALMLGGCAGEPLYMSSDPWGYPEGLQSGGDWLNPASIQLESQGQESGWVNGLGVMYPDRFFDSYPRY